MNYPSIARALTWRYVIALSLVAALSTAAWISLHLVISEQKSTAAVVNVSGRQRMLSQRTALFSNLLVNAPKAERPLIRGKLKEAIDLMARSHHGLTHGDKEMELPDTLSPAIRSIYFDGSNALDRQVETYIKAVRDLLLQDDEALIPDNPLLRYITHTAPTTLVAALDQMVRQYQLEGEASVERLQKAETIFWAVTLLLLMLEATLIFHPFVRHVRFIIGKLQTVTEELQLHQDQLEELVTQRTVALESRGKELAESEEKFRLISTSAHDAITIIGEDEQVIYWNPAAEKIFGYKADEAIGKNLHTLLIPTNYYDEALSGFRHSGEGNIIGKTFEITALRKSGEEFPVELSISAFRLQDSWHALGIIRDITERKRSEEALLQQKQLSDDIINSLPGIFYMLDTGGRFVRVNPQFLAVTGYAREELDRMTALDFFEGNDKNLIAQRMREVFETGDSWAEAELIIKSGHSISYYFTGHRIVIDERPYLVGLGADITDRRIAEDALRVTASVFENSQEAIVITSAENIILDVNPAFTHITGYSREEVLGRNPKLLSSGRQDKAFYAAMWESLEQKKAWRGEVWNRRKSGEIYAELLSIAAICGDDGRVQRYVGVFSDISHLKEHEAELSRVANYDALTGVPNRRLLADRLNQAIARAQRNGKMLSVCYIDLDGFKQVNDQYGHEAGDQLLVDVTRRLLDALRAGDTLARLGGDEFVLLFNDLAREQECLQILDRILDIVAMPIAIGIHEVCVSASIGVTFFLHDNEDGDTLLRHADQAMYIAKQTGKGRYHLYDSERDQRVRSLHESRRHILRGLESGEFELFYQPKIELVSGKVAGVEALIRWHHPERGLLLPAEFLPLIEDSDMEIRLGEWVMDTALAQLDMWSGEGLALEVSINISACHLQSPDFVAGLERKLARYPNLPRNQLQIEVLETAALEDIIRSAETIEMCRKLGVDFALDDFGTGYSSLAYLRKLSAETLKIDQSFVRGMLTDEGDRAIVQGIIALAKTFGRKTVAEGLEEPELIRILIEMGCMYGQGYSIAYPMPAGDFLKWHGSRK